MVKRFTKILPLVTEKSTIKQEGVRNGPAAALDVIMMDTGMRSENGMDAAQTICTEFPCISVIGLPSPPLTRMKARRR